MCGGEGEPEATWRFEKCVGTGDGGGGGGGRGRGSGGFYRTRR